jgi:hypothetical protein
MTSFTKLISDHYFQLALITGNLVSMFRIRRQSGCDGSAEDAYSSMEHDPTSAFVEDPCCRKLDFVFAIWIMITPETMPNLIC